MPYIAANPKRYLDTPVGNGQRAAYVRAAALVGHETTMSSIRPLLPLAFLVTSLASAAAVETSCPERQRDGKKIGKLDDARVFNGPPVDLVELMPNLETSEWDISVHQKYAEEHGESMYLVCHYKGIKKTVLLKIPYAATGCVIKGIEGGATYAGCTPSKPLIPK